MSSAQCYWWHYCRAVQIQGLAERSPEIRVRKGEPCPVCHKTEGEP